MTNHLTAVEVGSILNRLTSALPHDACRTCECFQGFLVQLLIDADQEAARLIAPIVSNGARCMAAWAAILVRPEINTPTIGPIRVGMQTRPLHRYGLVFRVEI